MGACHSRTNGLSDRDSVGYEKGNTYFFSHHLISLKVCPTVPMLAEEAEGPEGGRKGSTGLVVT